MELQKDISSDLPANTRIWYSFIKVYKKVIIGEDVSWLLSDRIFGEKEYRQIESPSPVYLQQPLSLPGREICFSKLAP